MAVHWHDGAPDTGLHGSPLSALAVWAEELTPLVSVEPPDALLLEVQGSLKLFGGLGALQRKLAAALEERGMHCQVGAAPTPLAALWLARHACADASASGALAGRLGALPLAVTRWPKETRALLGEMGVYTVGDCLRLPRDGFARRVGAHYLRELDKALGKEADPRLGFAVPPSFSATTELAGERVETAIFAAVLEALIAKLAVDLRQRQRQVQRLRVVFRHARRPATVILLQLVDPAHTEGRLLDPLLARLERLVMPAPVVAIGVRADALLPMRIDTAALLPGGAGSGREPAIALVENLRGRFGSEGVYGLGLAFEHRPEKAWTKLTERFMQGAAEGMGPPPRACDRPLWILPAPVPLAGSAQIARAVARESGAAGTERIENGWWDGGEVSRDYYAVTTALGQSLWVYQDCASTRWYLHGIFG